MKKKRPKNKFTQYDLAAAVGVTAATIRNYKKRPDWIEVRDHENKEAYFVRVKKWMDARGLPGPSRNGGKVGGANGMGGKDTTLTLPELRLEQMRVKIERDLLATERGRKKILAEYHDELFQAVAEVLGKAGQKISKLKIPVTHLRKIDKILKAAIEGLNSG